MTRTFAKTMPQIPHWYTLRRKATSSEDFSAFVQEIRFRGVQRPFGRRIFTYLDLEAGPTGPWASRSEKPRSSTGPDFPGTRYRPVSSGWRRVQNHRRVPGHRSLRQALL